MSLRAIQKREKNTTPYKKHPIPPFRQKKLNKINNNQPRKFINIQRSKSFPDISDKYFSRITSCLITSKSETDVTKLAQQQNKLNANSINAKSEVCIVKILEHRTVHNNNDGGMMPNTNKRGSNSGQQKVDNSAINQTINIRRSSALSGNNNNVHDHTGFNDKLTISRRMSDEQSISVYSTPSNSTMLTPSEYEHRGFTSDNSTILRIPIIGYEIMEERARFTVYKLRVENPFSNDCWLVLRRYTDFVRLHHKLKQISPHINLQLPKKKIFGDNFNAVFLDNRVQGLQMFVNSIMANNELRCSKMVREFFCLDEPPSYSESMEECRAIFEAQEETIAHLKLQINSKNDIILSLQQKLIQEIAANERLKNSLKNITEECANCSKKLDSLEISQ